MSGHSKWATTKYRKGAQDSARAKVFAKIIRQVEVAAREGGSDMTANASLRTMYAKARDSSVPIDTIERAIKRGSGELEGVRYESISYEGYAPDGVAVIVECLSDNRNRTGAEIRNVFNKNGGTLAEPGAVIGFAGARVIEETIREKLPEGFQRSEYLLEHGMVDMVVPRKDLKATLARIVRLLMSPAPGLGQAALAAQRRA